MHRKQDILSFKHSFLSNFRPAPIQIGSLIFPSTEHAYHYCKFISFEWINNQIFFSSTAKEVKNFMKSINNKDDTNYQFKNNLDPDRDSKKHEIMFFLNILKYTQHKKLARQLKATWSVKLVELNDRHDNYRWVCNCWWDHCAKLPKRWKNKLGIILMIIRNLV